MAINTMNDLFVYELRDLYSAEHQLVSALPKMAAAANSKTLKSAFEDHLAKTQGHVTRLNDIFTQLGMSPGGKTCKAMQGLIAEGDEAIHMMGDPDVKDAALIGAA